MQGNFRKRLEFWQHEGNWTNRLIHGDSKLVLASLLEKEMMAGKAQMIYIDPPYGINFSRNTLNSSDGKEQPVDGARGAPREPEAATAFRDTWRLGIHSYLGYLADRIRLAHEMLSDSGSCFVQISERNVHLVRSLLDDMFGMENFVSQIAYRVSSGTRKGKGLRRISDYLLWYAKNSENMKFNRLYAEKAYGEGSAFKHVELENGTRRSMTRVELDDASLIPLGARPYALVSMHSTGTSAGGDNEPREFEGKLWYKPQGSHWRHTKAGFEQLVKNNRVVGQVKRLRSVYYFDDFPYTELTNTWMDTSAEMKKDYPVQTAKLPVQRCMLMSTDPGDLVIDITCGGGTIPIVAEEWGRRWIAIDTSRVAIMLTRKRLMQASLPTYLLTDTKEGQKRLAQDNLESGLAQSDEVASLAKTSSSYPDIKAGFVYNKALEVKIGDVAASAESILQTLFDDPHTSNQVAARVAGPFTVEQLMPHALWPNRASGEVGRTASPNREEAVQFVHRVLEHLKAAGIALRYKDQHVSFDSIEMREGFNCVQAEGRYRDEHDTECVAGIAVGPQFHPLTQALVDAAVREGNQIVERDVLFVFCFNVQGGGVKIGTQDYGSLPVNIVDMSGELHVPSYATSKSSRLFNVFGQPDIAARAFQNGKIWHFRNGKWLRSDAFGELHGWVEEDGSLAEGEMQVMLRGMDYFDPIAGAPESGDANDVACMFVDTNFNGESFFARHAYFPGETGKEKSLYEQIKNDLRARDFPEEAWAALHTKKSFRFSVPAAKQLDGQGAVEHARVAVKVISMRGVEAICVIPIDWAG